MDQTRSDNAPGGRDSAVHQVWLSAITGDLAAITGLWEAGRLEGIEEACALAAANGQLAVMQFLRQNCARSAPEPGGLLQLAAANGRLDIVTYLHNDVLNNVAARESALATAAGKGHLDVVRFLHESGTDILACRSVCQSQAISRRSLPTLRYLGANGVFPEGQSLARLIESVYERDIAKMEANLPGIDIGRLGSLVAVAVAEGSDEPKLMQFLQERGLDITADEHCAIRIAADRGRFLLVRHLHQAGADIHARQEEALRSAVIRGHLRIVRYLVENGSDITKIDAETLAHARLNGHVTVLNYLTDVGLDSIKFHRSDLEAMHEELQQAAAVFRPSKLWEFFNKTNMEQLRLGGIESFKRSVNQNYFNFIPYHFLDPQIIRLTLWWIRNLSSTPFRIRLVDPDVMPREGKLLPVGRRVFAFAHRYRIANILARKLRIDFGRSIQLFLYRWLVGTLWDFALIHDHMGLARRLSEPRVGSPVETYYGNRLISQDLAHSILECNVILREASSIGTRRLRIAEIGAGYGRLGYVLLHAADCRYAVFDIPPSLYISQWYLGELFPRKRIFRFRHFDRFEEIAGELENADIAFFTANQIALIPEAYFDLAVNISSLHELRPDQIENMLDHIYRITRNLVYLKQYKQYHNPYDKLVLGVESYRIPEAWIPRYLRDDRVDPRFFEAVIEARRQNDAHTDASGPPAGPNLDGQVSACSPTVSILLANYNHAEYLPTALSGICRQTLQAAEVIVVDDGSSDDSVSVIQAFAARFPNIRLLRNDRNRGQHYSIQRALLNATGDYVVWAASDDVLLPDFLERSMELLQQHPQAGLCFSRLSVFTDGMAEVRHFTRETHGVAFDYGRRPRYLSPQGLYKLLRRHYLWISGNTVLARRSALLEVGGFEESLRWHADWFAYYVVALRYGVCIIPDTLAMMRERPGTYSAQGIADPAQQSSVIRAILDAIKSPKYSDVLPIFQRCPSLLSLFGKRGLFVAQANVRDWDIALQLAVWHFPRFLQLVYGRYRQWLSMRKGRLRMLFRKLISALRPW